MPATATVPAGAVETVAFDQVEVRKWGTGAAEVITTYPHPNIRLIWTRVGASTSVEAQALHRDQLGSVRAVTTFKPLASGAAVSTLRREAAIYKPFGEQTEVLQATQVNQEQKGWIGERYDADAGLQFLNARYYDPEYGFFLQPDGFEVTATGVGTNRYSYGFNDPINKIDPEGNDYTTLFTNFFNSFFGAANQSATVSENNARKFGSAVFNEVRAIPGNIGSGAVDAYAFMRKGPVGSVALPDLAGAAGGDPLEIVGLLPAFKLPGKALEAAADVLRVVCSFDADTLVLTERELVPIDTIVPLQDRVWSMDQTTGKHAWNTVLGQSVAQYDHIVRVRIKDIATGAEQTITSNRIHPYFAQVPASQDGLSALQSVSSEGIAYAGPIARGHWIDASDLRAGYRLQQGDGTWAEVVSVTEEAGDIDAWNLTVAEAHTYFVAETLEDQPVWVHNSCGGFASQKLLDRHFRDHGADFDAPNAQEYEMLAKGFLTGKAGPGVLEGTRSVSGEVVRFDPVTNAFGVIKADGTVKTYFVPSPSVHRYANNLDYFNANFK
jgi:RHS repeat-associated protein